MNRPMRSQAEPAVRGDCPGEDAGQLAEIGRVVDRCDAGEFDADFAVEQIRDILADSPYWERGNR